MARQPIRSISIDPKTRGYVVKVGCMTLVYRHTVKDVKRMALDLEEYLLHPQEKEKEMMRVYGVEVDGPEYARVPPPGTRNPGAGQRTEGAGTDVAPDKKGR